MQLIDPAEVHYPALLHAELYFPGWFSVLHLTAFTLVILLTLVMLADSGSTLHSAIQVINENINYRDNIDKLYLTYYYVLTFGQWYILLEIFWTNSLSTKYWMSPDHFSLSYFGEHYMNTVKETLYTWTWLISTASLLTTWPVTLPYKEIKWVCHDLPLRNLFTQ